MADTILHSLVFNPTTHSTINTAIKLLSVYNDIMRKSCHRDSVNRSYLHIIHMFILWALSPILYVPYQICEVI